MASQNESSEANIADEILSIGVQAISKVHALWKTTTDPTICSCPTEMPLHQDGNSLRPVQLYSTSSTGSLVPQPTNHTATWTRTNLTTSTQRLPSPPQPTGSFGSATSSFDPVPTIPASVAAQTHHTTMWTACSYVLIMIAYRFIGRR